VGGITLLLFDLRTVHPIAMLVVIACTCKEAHKFVKSMIGGIMTKIRATMPFAEYRRFVACVLH
jgi:hypothetical protein